MKKPISKTNKNFSHKSHGFRTGKSGSVENLAGMVEEYQKRQKHLDRGWNPLRSLLEGYRQMNNLEAALKSAALAEDLIGESYRKDGEEKVRRHGHQRRIKHSVLENARQVITSKSNIEKLKACKSFEEIFELVASCCNQIHGVGPLYVYDTALRIGAFLGKMPEQIYLQAGALLGARALCIDIKKSPLSVNCFPKAMHGLNPYEIEDFLCINKDDLDKLRI